MSATEKTYAAVTALACFAAGCQYAKAQFHARRAARWCHRYRKAAHRIAVLESPDPTDLDLGKSLLP